jgi:hypothetical protein
LIILILMAWRQYWRKTENIRMKKLTWRRRHHVAGGEIGKYYMALTCGKEKNGHIRVVITMAV